MTGGETGNCYRIWRGYQMNVEEIDKNGKRMKLDVKKGDVVLFGKYAGSDVKVDGEDYKVLRENEILARVEEVLGLVELDGVLDLMPADLSGGMRKRVALARAIALAPAAILYDEPTTGLDPITANTINHLIRSLQKRLGVTSIVVTHDIHSAFSVGDRIAFLYEGRILFHGTTEQARTAPVPLLQNFLQGGGYA